MECKKEVNGWEERGSLGRLRRGEDRKGMLSRKENDILELLLLRVCLENRRSI